MEVEPAIDVFISTADLGLHVRVASCDAKKLCLQVCQIFSSEEECTAFPTEEKEQLGMPCHI